jgi:hypothetical protein
MKNYFYKKKQKKFNAITMKNFFKKIFKIIIYSITLLLKIIAFRPHIYKNYQQL